MTDKKRFKFLVEVYYNKVITEDEQHFVKMDSVVWEFTGDDRESTLKSAEDYIDEILTQGMMLTGGAVLKSIITPTAILQIGLVDMEKWEEEAKETD